MEKPQLKNKKRMKTHNKLKFSRNEEFAFKKGYKVTKEGVMYGLKGQVITNTDTSGYVRVGTKSKGKFITIYAHRLQAYQKFRNKIYESNILVRHLDGNNKNNSHNNIVLGTNKDNMLDRPKEERIAAGRKASIKTKKYDKDEVKRFYDKCKSYKETKEKFNISSSGTLHYVLNKAKM
jgi:hypothetical protein